jgi:hypothetical protein
VSKKVSRTIHFFAKKTELPSRHELPLAETLGVGLVSAPPETEKLF